MNEKTNQIALFIKMIVGGRIIKRSDNMFSSLRLINAIIEHADEQGGAVEDFFFDSEKEMGAHLLWDKWSIEQDMSLEDESWEDVDLLSKARWTKLAIIEFKLR
tara:strand:- start:202 stop:513 length:312 start_codon:yes stop_codon:yes gene_type:complete